MPTEPTPNSAPLTPDASAPPPTTVPVSGAPPTEFRFGNDAPYDWARGKTATEVLAMAGQMAEALQNVRPAPQAGPPQAGPPHQGFTDDDALTRPIATMRSVAQAEFQAAATPYIESMLQQNATMARQMAQQRFATDFSKYGPEIDAYMAKVPVGQRSLDLYEGTVKLVRGSHVEDLAQERVRELLAQGGGLERSSGAVPGSPGGPSGLDLTKLGDGMAEVAKARGLTVEMVRDFCKANHMTTDQWMAMAQNNQVLTSNAPFSWQVREEKLGAERPFAG